MRVYTKLPPPSRRIAKMPPPSSSYYIILTVSVCDDDSAPLIASRIKYDGFAEKGRFCV